MLLTNTAAAIAAELKQLASPLTVMGTPVGDGVEDHNSLAFGAIQLTVTAAGWVQTLLAIELLLADAVADSASSAATDEVVERLRGLLVGTCLARHCLGDIIVGIDTEERAARSAS